jgi:hypothetical protein
LWQGVGYDPQMQDSVLQPRSDAQMWGAASPDQYLSLLFTKCLSNALFDEHSSSGLS